MPHERALRGVQRMLSPSVGKIERHYCWWCGEQVDGPYAMCDITQLRVHIECARQVARAVAGD